jgi:hypothetical protein
LIEVVVAGSIAVIIIIIITGLFMTTDNAYRNEVPLREAQVRSQQVLDGLAKEIHEIAANAVFTVPVTGENLPTGISAPNALVILSARNSTGKFEHSGVTMEPIWKRTIAYMVLNKPQNKGVALYKLDFGVGSGPDDPANQYPTLKAITPWLATGPIQLEWRKKVGSILVSPPGTVQISRGKAVIAFDEVTAFSVVNPKLTSTTADDFVKSDGGLYAPDVWKISITTRTKRADGKFQSQTYETTTQGRN